MGQTHEQPLLSVLAGCGLAKPLWFAGNPAPTQQLFDSDFTVLNI